MASVFEQWRNDTCNLFQDVYVTQVLGDDAGEYTRCVLVIQPDKEFFPSSTTSNNNGSNKQRRRKRRGIRDQYGFGICDVNGRAYLQTVEKGSAAHKQGALPHDCVQYAAIVDDWNDPMGKDYDEIAEQALERERAGNRIPFAELKHLLGSNYLSMLPSSSTAQAAASPVPTTIQVGVKKTPSKKTNTRAVVLVLRRTIARTTFPSSSSSSSSLPRASLSVSSSWPHFRMDDECYVATQILQSLAEDGDTSLEASTIRTAVRTAHGLAFVRSHKVVCGLSLNVGSGILVARLPDGNWSAPSAIGMAGMGVGLSMGVGVLAYIFLLQTKEAVEHFASTSSNFTLGANAGAAFFGTGREVVGAASLQATSCGGAASTPTIPNDDEYIGDDDDEYNNNNNLTSVGAPLDVAPILAYAKSQGFYVGVSLEGSRMFTRPDLNAKCYQVGSSKPVTSADILGGKHPSPKEAEPLYEALDRVEFLQELKSLPILPKDIAPPEGPWKFDDENNNKYPLAGVKEQTSSSSSPSSTSPSLSLSESQIHEFYEAFSGFLFGGIAVEKLSPNKPELAWEEIPPSPAPAPAPEPRTLWLCQPESNGLLKIGLVSKLSNGSSTRRSGSLLSPIRTPTPTPQHHQQQFFPQQLQQQDVDDRATIASEEVTLDSALMVRFKICILLCLYVFLCMLTCLILALQTQDNQSLLGGASTMMVSRPPHVELSRKHSMALVDIIRVSQALPKGYKDTTEGNTNNESKNGSVPELQILCFETANQTLVVKTPHASLLLAGLKILLEIETEKQGIRGGKRSARKSLKQKRGKQRPISLAACASSSEEEEDQDEWNLSPRSLASPGGDWVTPSPRRNFPGRNFLREEASNAMNNSNNKNSVNNKLPKYSHGQLVIRDIAKRVHLPLSLSLCRVLLLDSSSQVISKWEQDRGDVDFERTPWTFPPATPRREAMLDSPYQDINSEHQLIASGSMCGAHRTISYERPRNGQMVRLSETHIVESDGSEKLVLYVSERMPRRGFSIKVKILLRAYNQECEATVLGEIRPVGKNMSNPIAVHKAFLLVVEELQQRYGPHKGGLLAGFLSVVDKYKDDEFAGDNKYAVTPSSLFRRREGEEKKEGDSNATVVKFEDMLKANQKLGGPDSLEPSFAQDRNRLDVIDPTKQPRQRKSLKKSSFPAEDSFGEDQSNPVTKTIEVTPLPKIRLSLMPSPREEDEDNLDEDGDPIIPSKSSSRWKKKKKSKKKTNM